MIVIIKKDADAESISKLKLKIESLGMSIHESQGEKTLLWGLIGDTSKIDIDHLNSNSAVEAIRRIQEPYKATNRRMHPEDTVVNIAGRKIGGGHFQVIAGPCSIETADQISEVANRVKQAGAGLLRGGAFKPRTSPYAFQGLEGEGLKLLLHAKEKTGLPIVTELMGTSDIGLFRDVDLIQIGARNMQNFRLLKEVGKLNTPILLKRGMSNTIDELLMSAEYIMAGGNENVILCERGIRTFETAYRNTLDITAIPMLRKKTHLPIVIDPSHAAGMRDMVEPLSMAAIAAGADGLMIEVHNNPETALCDGPQSITPETFDELMPKIISAARFFGKKI